MTPTIDLHIHSNASDGQFTPSETVRLAKAANLAAMALTDHDTLAGLPEALQASRDMGIECIPGCEISATNEGRELHILGLWVTPGDPLLEAALATLRDGREQRNRIILDKLARLGVHIDYEDVLAIAKGAAGRPHIARILVERGIVRDFPAAFAKYLGSHAKAYAPKPVMPLPEAIATLKRAGATVALAHPYLLKETGKPLEELVRHCMGLGLTAIEVYYTEHSPQKTREYLELARRLDLGVCGGSDFHGNVKPGIAIGKGRGKLAVPVETLDDLKRRRLDAGLWV